LCHTCVRVSERKEEFSHLLWSPACLDIRVSSDLSATLISETCDKSFDSSLNTKKACPYMRLSDCECCSPCNPDDEAIKLSGCWYFINTEVDVDEDDDLEDLENFLKTWK
jgi:hypothetical protein